MNIYHKITTIIILGLMFSSCLENASNEEQSEETLVIEAIPLSRIDSISSLFNNNPNYKSLGFDYPVGKPDAKGYYNAQEFGKNAHLGDDWNATTGGNSDLGDPIYAISNGYVHFAEDMGGGWGNIIRIWHQKADSTIIESFYAHCDEIIIETGRFVNKGEQIGTIGNCNGIYSAHLHFEIREDIELPIGGGYGNTVGYLDPTKFIEANRK